MNCEMCKEIIVSPPYHATCSYDKMDETKYICGMCEVICQCGINVNNMVELTNCENCKDVIGVCSDPECTFLTHTNEFDFIKTVFCQDCYLKCRICSKPVHNEKDLYDRLCSHCLQKEYTELKKVYNMIEDKKNVVVSEPVAHSPFFFCVKCDPNGDYLKITIARQLTQEDRDSLITQNQNEVHNCFCFCVKCDPTGSELIRSKSVKNTQHDSVLVIGRRARCVDTTTRILTH